MQESMRTSILVYNYGFDFCKQGGVRLWPERLAFLRNGASMLQTPCAHAQGCFQALMTLNFPPEDAIPGDERMQFEYSGKI